MIVQIDDVTETRGLEQDQKLFGQKDVLHDTP